MMKYQTSKISGTRTTHTAQPVPGDQGLWEVSWLPGQPMDVNHAYTAIALADMLQDDERLGQGLSLDIIEDATSIWAGKGAELWDPEPDDPESGAPEPDDPEPGA
jgi:hypothetical protein